MTAPAQRRLADVSQLSHMIAARRLERDRPIVVGVSGYGGSGKSALVPELVAGVRRLPNGRRKAELTVGIEAAVEPYRGSRSTVPFDEAAADRYADVLVAREWVGAPIGTADAQIAAICLAHGAACATRNVGDFTHTGIDVIDPWAS